MSILLCLLAAISVTTFIIPAKLDPATLKVSNLNVYAAHPECNSPMLMRESSVYGRSQPDRREQEFAFARFDVKAGMQPAHTRIEALLMALC